MIEDVELLRRYSQTQSEEAFAELVRRHLNLVYSAALRQVGGDAYLAEDVTQSVFGDLARKASSLSQHRLLAGWLYTSAHLAAAKTVRGEQRRRNREQEAHLMKETNSDSSAELQWEQLQPVIDDAMHELPETDREAILQRYFEKKPFVQIGAKLGLTENAARMRVERALEKLRGILAVRGVASTSVVLAAVLGAQVVSAAPAALSATVVGTSLAAGTGGAATVWSIFTAAKLKIAVPVACVIAAAVALLVQNAALSQLRKENATLLAGQRAMVDLPEAAATSAADAEELERLKREHLELLRLRGEVSRLRREMAEVKAITTPTNAVAESPVEEESTQQINIKAYFVTADDLALLGLSVEAVTGIPTADQMKWLLKKLQESHPLDYLSQLQVTTLSGRQAKISAAQSVTNGSTVTVTGPTLDILPTIRKDIRKDGRMIELRIVGNTGYSYELAELENSGVVNPPIMAGANTWVVWDGQTAAESMKLGNQRFVIFVTPTLIDPAGNPIHAEAEKAAFIEPNRVQQ